MPTTVPPSTSMKLIARHDCAPDRRCPSCSVFMVVRHRFDAFRAKFGREPKPVEPLFFDPSKSQPVRAGLSEARAQIEAAAVAVGVKPETVFRFLKLDSAIPQEKMGRLGESSGRVSTKTQRPNGFLRGRSQSTAASAWERFEKNEHLHRVHNVSRKELKTLSRLALMGEVRNSQDFLYILKQIREAGL
jgi:hypothetical protein